MTPGDGTPEPGLIHAEDLREKQRRSRERIEQFQARALSAKAALDGATTTVTSRDRSVTVTVNQAGTLLDLTFAASAGKVPLSALAGTVLATYRQATLGAVAQTESVMRELVGDDSPLLAMVRAAVPDTDPADDPKQRHP